MRCRLDSQADVIQRGKVCLKIMDEMPWNTFTTPNNFKVFNQNWPFQYLSISFYNLLENDCFLPLLWMFVLHCAAGAAPQTSACRGTHSWVRPTSPCAMTAAPLSLVTLVRVELVHVGALPSLPPFVLLHSYINIIIHIQYRTILYIYTYIIHTYTILASTCMYYIYVEYMYGIYIYRIHIVCI